MRAHDDFNRRARGKSQRHFQIASPRTQIAQMAIVPHRTSLLINLRAQTARVSRLPAAIIRFRAQSSHRIPFAALRFLLHRGLTPSTIAIRLYRTFPGSNGVFHFHPLRSQLPRRRIRQIALQPLAQNAPRSLRHIHKLHSRAPVPILPHHLPGEPHRRRLPRQLKLKINFASRRQFLAKIYRHAICRQIHQRRPRALSARIIDGRMRVHCGPRLAPLVLVQHGLSRAQRARRPLMRHRLVQHKVDPERKHLPDALLPRHYHHRQGLAVHSGRTALLQ